jgi:primosomal protein N' (replication factor Y)
VPAAEHPVARVCVDTPLPHLDRLFDYLVPAEMSAAAQPGVRVKVRFAGQQLDGFLLERADSSEHQGKLSYLDKVVSPEIVLTPEVARAARAIADRYAGTLADVLRLAVPPRHGRAEKAPAPALAPTPAPAPAAEIPDPAPTDPPPPEIEPLHGEYPHADQPNDQRNALGHSEHPHAPAHSEHEVGSRRVDHVDASGRTEHTGASGRDEHMDAPGRGGHLDAPGRGGHADAPGHVEHTDASGRGEYARAPERVERTVALGRGEHTDVSGRAEHTDVSGRGGYQGAPGGWVAYPAGEAFIRALADGKSPRAVWSALPGEDWPTRLAEAAAATASSGRGTLIVVADQRDLDRVDTALTIALRPEPTSRLESTVRPEPAGRPELTVGPESTGRPEPDHHATRAPAHIALSAALGPEARYKRFLRASRGEVKVVAGTRAAAFAPVPDLGLVVIWDDGDDVHADPHSPYPHAREVVLTRAHLGGAAALVGGFSRTAEGQQLVETDWARDLAPDREAVRRRAPHVVTVADDSKDIQTNPARLPSVAWKAAQTALAAGQPVLVQVPRRGYLPSIACAKCRTPSRCPHCHGPLSLNDATGPATCRWCARIAAGWQCTECGSRALRASIVGARRTAEELGRAFAGVPVRTSGRESILVSVPAGPALVISTPGAEPYVEHGGYGAVLLLDTWALLTRADLRAGEETLRRWLAAASLARPAAEGGTVVVVADGQLAAVQALVRFDPAWLAARDLAERRELGFPPAARMASLTGTSAAVEELLATARLPDGAEILGPVPAGEENERFLVRVPRGAARAMAYALRTASGVRSLRKAPESVRVQVDPIEIL